MEEEHVLDRQIRLWGEDGQRDLARSRVCCVGLNALAVELLKNLVLAGVGAVCLLRERPDEAAPPLFLLPDSDDDNDDDEVAAGLRALNRSVSVRVDGDLAARLAAPQWFSDFDAVVVAEWRWHSSAELASLAGQLYTAGVPLLLAQSSGHFGLVAVQLRSHIVVDSRPDYSPAFVSLSRPWPQLQQLVDDWPPFADMSDAQFAVVPFVVVLLRAKQLWPADRPQPTADQLIDLLLADCPHRTHTPNVDEARRYARCLWADELNDLPALQQLFNIAQQFHPTSSSQSSQSSSSQSSQSSSSQSSQSNSSQSNSSQSSQSSESNSNQTSSIRDVDAAFWQVVLALQEFYEQHGRLPVGGVPDMETSTQGYVQLRRVYEERQKADCQQVVQLCAAPVELVGRLCQTVRRLQHVASAPVWQQLDRRRPLSDDWRVHDDEEDEEKQTRSRLRLLLMLSRQAFFDRHGRLPTRADDGPLLAELAADTLAERALLTELAAETLAERALLTELAADFADCPASHASAAAVGGLAGLETVKVLTRQWLPLSEPVFYDGRRGAMWTW